MLNVESRHGGLQSLVTLQRENGLLPSTASSRTGGGGVHVYFRYPTEKEVRNNAGWLGSGTSTPPSRYISQVKA